MKLQIPDAILAMSLMALLIVTALAVDQRAIIKRRDARIQELCDLCNALTLENVGLKQAAKEPKE